MAFGVTPREQKIAVKPCSFLRAVTFPPLSGNETFDIWPQGEAWRLARIHVRCSSRTVMLKKSQPTGQAVDVEVHYIQVTVSPERESKRSNISFVLSHRCPEGYSPHGSLFLQNDKTGQSSRPHWSARVKRMSVQAVRISLSIRLYINADNGIRNDSYLA